MSAQVEHEHWFFDHEDPRYLICDCGQYAVRTRNNAGERIFRLIDPPRPALLVASVTELTSCPDAEPQAHTLDVREIAV